MKQEEIKHVFDSYPEQQSIHITEDGVPFLEANDAINYSREKKLNADAIEEVKRSEVAGSDSSEEIDIAKMNKAQLVEFCKLNEIALTGDENKAQILDAIQAQTSSEETK